MAKVAAELGKLVEPPPKAGIYVWGIEDHEGTV
jgi:hypothetical protein